MPNSPLSLLPQQETAPSSHIAQVCVLPNANCETFLPGGSSTVAKLSPTSSKSSPKYDVFSMPNCPKSLAPQQIKSSLSNSAQVWPPPASIIVAVVPEGKEIDGNISPVSK